MDVDILKLNLLSHKWLCRELFNWLGLERATMANGKTNTAEGAKHVASLELLFQMRPRQSSEHHRDVTTDLTSNKVLNMLFLKIVW